MAKQTAPKSKWQSVFDCHPDAKCIYVVGKVPFLKERDANSYAAGKKGAEVEKILRNAKPEPEVKEEVAEPVDLL